MPFYIKYDKFLYLTTNAPYMWSSEVLDMCAIIRIRQRFPRELRLFNRKMMLENSFFFLSRENKELYFYRNLERKLSDLDRVNLEKDSEFEGTRMKIVSDMFLQIKVEDELFSLLNKLNETKWSRVNPCILSHSQDAYIQLEFIDDSRENVSKILLEFVDTHVQEVDIIYFGRQSPKMPYIIKLFLEFGGNINDLFLIKTEWHMTLQNIQNENSGVFQNEGKFIPNYFTNGSHDKLIFKLDNVESTVRSNMVYVSIPSGVFEIDVKTNFFSDFNNEIVSKYYGTLFYEAEIKESILTNFYIVDKNISSLFMAGLKKHWDLPKRSIHKNIMISAMELGEIYKQSDLKELEKI